MVRFLHISEKPITEWRDTAGRTLQRVAKPHGFWMARDLTWVALMDRTREWAARPDKEMPGREAPGRILAAYEHVFAGRTVPAPKEGETIHPLRWKPHYVYEVTLPETAFSSDITSPDRSRVFQLSRKTLDAFLETFRAFRRDWDSPVARTAIQEALTKTVDWTEEDIARAAKIRELVKKPKAPVYTILDSSPEIKIILAALADGTLTLRRYAQRELDVAAWRDFLAQFRTQWGGLEFMADLFTPEGDDPELVARAEILRRLDVPSAVLFSVTSPPPLRAILSGVEVSTTDAPVYQFGVTDSGELRILSQPSGGRRRRTRRRMFKNPKTLKKRIR